MEEWLKQFEHFGQRWVGEALLRQVDIISPDELSQAFDFSAQAKLGSNLLFTFLLDDDHGSSSNRIGAMLTHMYGPTEDLVSSLTNALSQSRIVVCEDALWTGAEFRKLMKRLAPGGDLNAHTHDKRFSFRHCVVSDYGILAARHYLERNKLHFIDLWTGDRQRFVQVLAPHCDEKAIRTHWHLSPEEFDRWLSTNVAPLAFQNAGLWDGRQEEGQILCQHIGAQLVDKYATEHSKNWPENVRTGFAMGGMRFGSTLMFAHSVPKVCLPIFWLGGPIEVDGKRIEWKPLLFDARRT
ncbi:MAG: hypothetical protein K2Y71_21170 [Xanthobacteraceae bacterium]|nr:hypothetical protein [Xanthobacteraceae bacterium]